MKRGCLIVLLLVHGIGVAFAHGGGAEEPGPTWTFDPWITIPLLAFALSYSMGFARLWRRAEAGRRTLIRHALAYAAGWLSAAGALVTPLHWLGERLFTAHMVEHEIIMAIAAPLLVLARPGGVFLWAFPSKARHAIGRLTRGGAVRAVWVGLTRPMTATVLHAVAIWTWHVPLFFDEAVTEIALHRLQHLSFLSTGVLFWWAMLRRSDPAVAAGEVFVTMIHTGILGALMTFAPRVLYQVQTAQAWRWGLTPLEDQQLAGLVMWVPAGTVYAGAAIAFLGLWVNRSGRAWKADDALVP
jgi:putative membrane protein